ncbi:MAG TPA: hypothetical protein VLX92_01030 [Kofleriaceae bacterium]|nr:hypothetical protein [Kofleriaceae bacterium]
MRLALALLLASRVALADRAIVVGRVDRGTWSDAPTEARRDQKAELSAVVLTRAGKLLAPDGVAPVRIGGKAFAHPSPLAATFHWLAVEPHGFRTTPASNGATSDYYSNVSTDPRTFGRWLGFDHIDYFERELPDAAPIIAAEVATDDAVLPGLGTLRYKVVLELPDGRTLASPGVEATDTYGILPGVHRVSIRAADDFLGWLTSYLNVPEVFGSAGGGRDNQTDRFDGADCADVMVGAMRRMGRTDLAYTNVAGLPAYTTRVSGSVELDDRGQPERPITGARPGDLIRIDYGGELRGYTPRAWDHVVALWQDRSDPAGPFKGGPDGKLDGFDLVIHMGHPHLMIEPLSAMAPATIDVWRWKRR